MNFFRILLAAMLGLLMAAPILAQEADPLIGLWGAELDFGPKLRDELIVKRSGADWVASLGGQRTRFTAAGGQVRFSFPGGDGFRGNIAGKAIRGFWLQPAGDAAEGRDPGGSGQRFATPLVLQAAGTNQWRGTVVPLDRRFTLWLSIFRAPDGVLTAAFRNPEA